MPLRTVVDRSQIPRAALIVPALLMCTDVSAADKTPTLTLSWAKNYLTIHGAHLPGGEIKVQYLELDEQDRAMLVMKEVAGFTVEEIGNVLDLNVNTVKVRLFRARGRLMEVYRRRLKGRPAKPPARRF